MIKLFKNTSTKPKHDNRSGEFIHVPAITDTSFTPKVRTVNYVSTWQHDAVVYKNPFGK